MGVTIVLVVLTLAGTAVGADDDFPFGPLRMYARSHDLDQPVRDTWPWAIDAEGREFRLSQAKLGVRRAEIEGQLGAFRADPQRLELLADAYEERHPDAPAVEVVEIRTRIIEMGGGKPTGEESTIVRARWER